MSTSATTIFSRIEALSKFSEDKANLTRTFMTPTHRAAAEQLLKWMQDAGMKTRMDAIGNVIGRYEGNEPGLPALVVGSHYDTVRNAGKYDGQLGVISGIACVEALNHNNERLSFAVEVIGFSEEEGVRYGATLLGSRGFAGTFDFKLLEKQDADGITMSDAIRHYGLDPDKVSEAARNPADIHAYIEAHIEQGPVLLQENLPVGIVTSIASATRYQVVVTGPGGHAGTVPMNRRHDALNAAAELVLFIEQRCSQVDGTFGTVGELDVIKGAANSIPMEVRFSIDIRAGDNATRIEIIKDLQNQIELIANKRKVNIDAQKTHEANAATCNQELIAQLEAAAERSGIVPRKLVSGAGHDAMALPDLTPIAMLFVRCGNGGVSHHPDEIMTSADAETAVQVMLEFIRHFKPVTK